jgi:hypothetical protein
MHADSFRCSISYARWIEIGAQKFHRKSQKSWLTGGRLFIGEKPVAMETVDLDHELQDDDRADSTFSVK